MCYINGMQETVEKVASMLAGLESAGLTRTQIARGAQISRQTLYRLLNGEYSAPSYETIIKLEALEIRTVPFLVKSR